MPLFQSLAGDQRQAVDRDQYFDAGLRVAQSVAIVRQIPMIILGNGFGAVLGAFVLREPYGWGKVMPMLVIMWALLIPIVLSWRKLRDRPAPPYVSASRIVKLTVHSAALGVAWALAMLIYLPGLPADTLTLLVLGCTVLALASTGAVYVLPRASIAYSIPIFVSAFAVASTISAIDHGFLAALILAMAAGAAWILYANWINFQQNIATAAEARRLLGLAEHAVAARNTFLENVSHEIRTPLTSIAGYAHLLEREEALMTAGQNQSVQRLKRAASTLMGLADDLIDIAILDAGQAVISRVPVDVRAIIQDASAAAEARMRAKGLDFVVRIHPDVPQHVEGDPLRIQKIVAHLLDNAGKYTEAGAVRLEVGWHETPEATLEIQVIDTGIGIAPEERERIFQRFSQIDQSTRRRRGGTGLGLAICRETLSLMNGSIELLGDDARTGSHFRVTIPARELSNAKTAKPGAACLGAHTRFLVVDDDHAIREFLRQLLARIGVRVDVADSGYAAVSVCCRARFDVILMDIQMPGMDGMETAAAIRQVLLNAKTPIVAITGYVSKDRLAAIKRAGIDDILGKPINEDALVVGLSKYLPLPMAGGDTSTRRTLLAGGG